MMTKSFIPKKRRKLSLRLFVTMGVFFAVAGGLMILVVNWAMKDYALEEAKAKALIILDRNLATHTYFSHQLKPAVFKLVEGTVSTGYFDPVWMSSTYAVREIEKAFRSLNPIQYYYKECAINARSPENEADPFERRYLEKLKTVSDPEFSTVRTVGGSPYLVVLRPGEMMEASCLRCHSLPEVAPKELVRVYGPERSFHRKAGDVVSAISMRIPLASAYEAADRFTIYLSILFLGVLIGLFLVGLWLNQRWILTPLKRIRDKAKEISTDPEQLGKKIDLPSGEELYDVTEAFNEMSIQLRKEKDYLEARIAERTNGIIKERDRSQTYLNVAGVMILALNGDGEITLINQKGCDILQATEAEILGKNWFDHFLQNEDAAHAKEVFMSLMSGQLAPVEYEEGNILTKDGKEKVIAWHNAVLKDEGGRITGTLSSGEDVTDRKRMEAQLEAERSRLFSVLDSMPAVVDVVDAETYDILFMNTYIREIYGHDGVGKKCYAVFHNFDAPCSFCNNETLLEKGEDESVQWEYFSETLKRHLITTNRLLKWPDGRRAKLEMSIDITDRKKAEHARKDLEAQLYQSQKLESVGRLAGGVAHDFNNMLGVILGKAEMALMELEPEDAHYADFREIQKVASRSADLTRQLLAFARRQTIAPRVLDLNETIEGMLKMMRRLIGEDIDLAWLPGSGLWPIKMDPSQIDQILANLCVNARDAIQDTGKITIETDTAAPDQAYCDQHTGFVPGEYVVLTISDDGFGMDKETINHIFDPFFTTKALGKGTGLGLATVYGIVKQNDGFIHVYSEPGKGSTFKIYFRRHVEQADPVEPKTSASPLAQGDETILLVEDDAEILHIALSMLERLGYRVLPVSSPGEAIREADMHPGDIHLLITDVVMPDMNGRDLSKRILSLYPNIKCLFMSGYTANVIAHHGVLDEGVHFIEKPFSINDLSAKVREALEVEAV